MTMVRHVLQRRSHVFGSVSLGKSILCYIVQYDKTHLQMFVGMEESSFFFLSETLYFKDLAYSTRSTMSMM